jgi:uncharacterized protein DUF1566
VKKWVFYFEEKIKEKGHELAKGDSMKTLKVLIFTIGLMVTSSFYNLSQAQIKSWGFIPDAGQRFQVLSGNFGGAVLDRETGLIWTKQPLSNTGQSNLVDWAFAVNSCYQQSIDGRLGWRLPKLEELLSLKDLTNAGGPDNTNLPLGHPFLNVLNGNTQFYWSSTTVANDPNSAYGVSMSFSANTPLAFSKSDNRGVWCVRGGAN